MKNDEVYFALGKLTAEVKGLRTELKTVQTDVAALVQSDTLAKGGKKMLYKVGAVCSTLGAGLATAAGYALEHLKP